MPKGAIMTQTYKEQTLADAIASALNQNKRNGHITLLLVRLRNKLNNDQEYTDEIEHLRKHIGFPGILNLINNFCC